MPTPHPYPAYKPSGVPWLGDVPLSWEVRRIKALFRESEERRGQKPIELFSLTRTKGLIPQSENSSPTLLAEDLSGYKICRPTDIVMNRMQAWSGMFAVPPHEGIVSPDYSVFSPTTTCEIEFFEHLFKTPILVEQFAKNSKGIGSGFNRLYSDDFGNIIIPLPPLPEQTAIVRYLDHADRRIRRYVSAKRKLIALLGEEKQAVINHAVTRGLDPNVRLKPSGVEWLGDVPEHWETVQLGRIGTFSKGTGGTKEDEVSEGIPCVRYGDLYMSHKYLIRNSRAFVTEEKQPNYTTIEYGDVLFAGSGETIEEIGKSAVNLIGSQVCCGGDVILFRPEVEINATFSGYAIDCPQAQYQKSRMGRGITIMHIYSSQLKNLWIGLPSLSEQDAIVEYLDKAAASIDAAIARARRQIELLEEYRTRLIADVVTGKLDVRDAAAGLPEAGEEPEEDWRQYTQGDGLMAGD